MNARNEKLSPPRWAGRFLDWFLPRSVSEEIQGDLHEAFHYRVKQRGPGKARLLFVLDVFRFFRIGLFGEWFRMKVLFPMFPNYLKIALRNIRSNKGYAMINATGLAVGLATTILILLYIRHESTYDTHFPDHKKTYRLVNTFRSQTYSNMKFVNYYGTEADDQLNMPEYLEGYSEIVTACQLLTSSAPISSQGEYYMDLESGDQWIQDDILFTNTGRAFNEIFPQKFLAGNPGTALNDRNSAILTRSTAEKYFGPNWINAGMLGMILTIGEELFEIRGVVEDLPDNTHFHFEMIMITDRIPSWGAYTYFTVRENTDIGSLQEALNKNIDNVYPGYTEDELEKGVTIQALTGIHFNDGFLYEMKAPAKLVYLRIFAVVALVVMLITWTNYMNLSIAIYSGRQKEMGVRKVMGALPLDIRYQLLFEAILLTIICLPVAWIILWFALPWFNQLMGITILPEEILSTRWIFLGLGIAFLSGLLSGAYPSIVFANKGLLQLFGNKFTLRSRISGLNLRRVLVSLQFIFLITLTSVTLFIVQQMNYVGQKDLGYNREGVLSFALSGVENFTKIKTALEQYPEFEAIGSGGMPGHDMYNQITYKIDGTDIAFDNGTHTFMSLGSVEVLGMESEAFKKLQDGKNKIFVINETAAELLANVKGVEPEDLIGDTFILEPEYENEDDGTMGWHYTIDGIIPDFNYFSLKYEVNPQFVDIYREPEWSYEVLAKVNTTDMFQTLSRIETEYKKLETQRPLQLTFLDDRLDKLYQSEQQSGVLITVLSLLAIMLALLGLIGLVSYMTYTREKEIGIRKVFGASFGQILVLINREFIILVGLAAVIAFPAAMFVAGMWLQNFAYHIDINFLVVVLAALICLAVVVSVVSIQSGNSISKKVADVLKYE